jgi:hypothetical protein
MESHREHPLYYLDAETLLVATYVWVDDQLKALQAQGVRLPRPQKGQKATLAEFLTLAIFITLVGQDLAKGYMAAKTTLRPFFPSLPHLSRFYRVLKNAQALLAHLALSLPHSAVGVGPLGAFAGYVLLGVMTERGLFFRWGILPGNARETWGAELLEGLPALLGDRGFRWVPGVKTPPYRLRGGKRVETGWRGWMGKVRNWIETRFSVMVRSLGLHRIASRSFEGFLARVNLILLVHNLIRSRLLLRMAGVEG